MRRIIALLTAILFLLAGGSCAVPTTPPPAAELLNLGEKYLQELDYEQALVQFLAVIDIKPMNARAYLGAAEAYIALGDTDAAIAVLEQGLEATSDAGIAEMLLGLTELNADEPVPSPENKRESEYEIIEKTSQLLSDYINADTLHIKGTSYQESGTESFEAWIDGDKIRVNWGSGAVSLTETPETLAYYELVEASKTVNGVNKQYINWFKMNRVDFDSAVISESNEGIIYDFGNIGRFYEDSEDTWTMLCCVSNDEVKYIELNGASYQKLEINFYEINESIADSVFDNKPLS